MLDPVQRRRYGVTSLALSAVFVVLSVAAGATTAIKRESVVEEKLSSDQQCQANVTSLGASTVQMNGDNLVAEWTGVEGGYTAIGSASAAAMACPGWKMESFCMGQECQNSGVKLEMRRVMAE